ncbi:hypothetical protein K4749_01435 [Streptomyces sp. TRM72054]|uniref:hypothetical protein n=1 Tax=Streptomyces sp. TRM72054 TaxID=2870562 RepID=UPI001C8BF33D|nr:hypothetical protein [Streptomyces sp. TRM72054]MBX9392291.1 hypothetical protein [Streptomyces sp. TRM72054]
MSPDLVTLGSVRSAAVVNEEIRALWARGGGQLGTRALRAEYERLVVEWAAAVQAERLTEAA